jgi:hypothetical protein
MTGETTVRTIMKSDVVTLSPQQAMPDAAVSSPSTTSARPR